MKFFIIFTLLFSSVPLFSLETNITLKFWTDHYPPGSNKYWFREVKKSFDVLNSNIEEIQLDAHSKGISLVSINTARKIVDKFIREHPAKEEFVFYEFEKAQMVLIVQMFLNHSRTYNTYSKKEALDMANNFIFKALGQINRARYSAKENAHEFDNNYNLLSSMLGKTIASQIKNIFRKY